ncbi:ring finger domain protein [Zalerion maritima]|uniref:Large ribosomal subunit protein mL40 n=1 Tax=Zalerion maritima TaxID=339359 RepID=A0AAD5RU98_9PEZI|nr:ring finger domain protein [Zalerion maritima]
MSFLARPVALLGSRAQATSILPLRPLVASATCSSSSRKPTPANAASAIMPSPLRAFSTTPSLPKRMSGKLNPNRPKHMNQKIYVLRRWRSKRLPAPLRMGRNRYLRHWTIHRAWLLYQRQEKERRQTELMRMQASMAGALEELRTTSGPGSRGEGYLYRLAVKKARVWGLNAIPIEYARMQTETPPREAWNHAWRP